MSRGRDGEGVNSVSAVVCAIRVRAVAREGILASIAASPVTRNVKQRPASSAVKFLLSFLSTRTKKDSGQSNDRSGARDNRKTPRGKKNGGLAWWSRRQREARILPAFKDQYATLVSVLGPTWHGPQNLFVMEKKNQRKKKCI